jgi:hypothetical protein
MDIGLLGYKRWSCDVQSNAIYLPFYYLLPFKYSQAWHKIIGLKDSTRA